jgi:hypothetical protein
MRPDDQDARLRRTHGAGTIRAERAHHGEITWIIAGRWRTEPAFKESA